LAFGTEAIKKMKIIIPLWRGQGEAEWTITNHVGAALAVAQLQIYDIIINHYKNYGKRKRRKKRPCRR
jgi:hypothetical protein